MRQKIDLITGRDVNDFVKLMGTVPAGVYLEDGEGNRVSAKSLLLTAAAKMEWSELYVTCDHDIYHLIEKWAVTNSEPMYED